MDGTACSLRITVRRPENTNDNSQTNHICADNPRSISRFLSDKDEHRELSAKLLCLMQTTLSGTLYVYQGEELGQRNMPPSFEPSEYKDIETINYWEKVSHTTATPPLYPIH